MELELTQATYNPVMGRYELEISLNHSKEPTPSREDVVSRLTAEENIDKGSVNVRNILSKFGSEKSAAEVYVDGSADLDSVEEGEASKDYSDVLNNSVSDAKERIQEIDNPNWEKLLKEEKQGKNRKTLKQWIENNIE